jgi:hypothetical protein
MHSSETLMEFTRLYSVTTQKIAIDLIQDMLRALIFTSRSHSVTPSTIWESTTEESNAVSLVHSSQDALAYLFHTQYLVPFRMQRATTPLPNTSSWCGTQTHVYTSMAFILFSAQTATVNWLSFIMETRCSSFLWCKNRESRYYLNIIIL